MWAGELPEAHNASDPLVRMNQLVFPAYEQAGEQLQPEQVLIVVRFGAAVHASHTPSCCRLAAARPEAGG